MGFLQIYRIQIYRCKQIHASSCMFSNPLPSQNYDSSSSRPDRRWKKKCLVGSQNSHEDEEEDDDDGDGNDDQN